MSNREPIKDCIGTYLKVMRDADKNIAPDIEHLRTAFNLMSSKEKVEAVVALQELTLSLRDQLFGEIDAEVAATVKLNRPQPPKAG